MTDQSTSLIDRNEFPFPDILGESHDGIAFSTRGCATAEEADVALEAFLTKAFGVSDEAE